MPENQSDKSRYSSRYGGGFISPAQYIAELMCERIASSKGKNLIVKFWNSPEWKKPFMVQLLAANSLLKLYKPQAIISGLRRSPKTYTLHAKWLDELFQEEEAKLIDFTSQESAVVEEVKDNIVVEKPRETFNQEKSKLAKLRELDG